MQRQYTQRYSLFSLLLCTLIVIPSALAAPLSNTYTYQNSDYNVSIDTSSKNKAQFTVAILEDKVLQSWDVQLPAGCKTSELKWNIKSLTVNKKPVGWLASVAPGCCCASHRPENLGQTQQNRMSLFELITVNNKQVSHQSLQGMELTSKEVNKKQIQITYFQFTGTPALNLIEPQRVNIDANGAIKKQTLTVAEIESLLFKQYPNDPCIHSRLYLSQCLDKNNNNAEACQEQKIFDDTCVAQSQSTGE